MLAFTGAVTVLRQFNHAPRATLRPIMNILDILSPKAIKVPLDSTEKKAAIDELIDLLAANGSITQPDQLKRVVWEREQQRTTGIGEGLAIPHGKSVCSNKLVIAIWPRSATHTTKPHGCAAPGWFGRSSRSWRRSCVARSVARPR
jgi:hypothetical protein